MNQPIQLTDISTDLASRAVAALYRNGAWVDTAPTHIIGAVVDELGYIIVITNDELTAVYRYTNREQLKRLQMWPQGITTIAAQYANVTIASARRTMLGRPVGDES